MVAANLFLARRDADAQAEALLAIDADVALVVEHSPATAGALERAGIAERYPHRLDDPHETGFFGSLVASRLPIARRWQGDLGGRPGMAADVTVGTTTVRLVPVHTQAPVHDRDLAPWQGGIAAIAAVADGAPGPVVLAGDWNATGGHRVFRRALAAHDLVDAQTALGHRWYPTWPVGLRLAGVPIPRVLTLDHVVVSRGVGVARLERIRLPGTDHLALRAELRLA